MASVSLLSAQNGVGLQLRLDLTKVLILIVFVSFSPAVTSYTSQVAFPPLAQSSMYSAFPQTGQNYGLPPFG